MLLSVALLPLVVPMGALGTRGLIEPRSLLAPIGLLEALAMLAALSLVPLTEISLLMGVVADK